jgi:hypothetical protein
MNTIKIVDGPNKFDLMASLFSKPGDANNVGFEVEGGARIKVAIQLVQREDGSGENWNIEIYPRLVAPAIETLVKTGEILRGYYNTRRRTGTFTLKD